MYHATSPAVPAAARERVRRPRRAHGWHLVVIDAGELADARYRANPIDRCYFCKTNLYARIAAATDDIIASGTNRDDLGDFRPGLRAAAERNVVHPYVEAGRCASTTSTRIARGTRPRRLERLPAQPCLASRVETGIAIDAADLAFIDDVERELAAQLGREAIVRCRVTHGGIVVELGAADRRGTPAPPREIAMPACAPKDGALPACVRYARGAAFLHEIVHV